MFEILINLTLGIILIFIIIFLVLLGTGFIALILLLTGLVSFIWFFLTHPIPMIIVSIFALLAGLILVLQKIYIFSNPQSLWQIKGRDIVEFIRKNAKSEKKLLIFITFVLLALIFELSIYFSLNISNEFNKGTPYGIVKEI